MGLIRPSVLLFALLISTPAVYRYATGDIDEVSVLGRFLIAVPIAAILLAGLRFITASYGTRDEEEPAVPVTPKPMDSEPIEHRS